MLGAGTAEYLDDAFAFLGFSPFAWFAWMVRVDSCHQEILFQRNEKKGRKAAADPRTTQARSTANDE